VVVRARPRSLQKVLTGAAEAEKVRRGLCAWLDECERGDELEREGRTCVTTTRAAVVAYRRVAGMGKRESTGGARTREPDDLVLHLVERGCVTIVNVGKKLFVRLLVARGFREVEAHESDEGVDVLDWHGLHLA
jgi:hypothetical protein